MLGAKGLTPSRSEHEWFVLVVMPRPAHDAPHPNRPGPTWCPRPRVDRPVDRSPKLANRPDVAVGRRNTSVHNGRVTADVFAGYQDRWELLHRPRGAAPVLLPEWMLAARHEPRIGLPPGPTNTSDCPLGRMRTIDTADRARAAPASGPACPLTGTAGAPGEKSRWAGCWG
jgi:hypothetical protein